MAIEREKELKAWRREKKNALVADNNPEWLDLADGWAEDPLHAFGMTAEKEG